MSWDSDCGVGSCGAFRRIRSLGGINAGLKAMVEFSLAQGWLHPWGADGHAAGKAPQRWPGPSATSALLRGLCFSAPRWRCPPALCPGPRQLAGVSRGLPPGCLSTCCHCSNLQEHGNSRRRLHSLPGVSWNPRALGSACDRSLVVTVSTVFILLSHSMAVSTVWHCLWLSGHPVTRLFSEI